MGKKSDTAEFKKMNDDLDYCLSEKSTYPNVEKFSNFENFLQTGGADIKSLKIKHYTEDYRGVHASQDIKKGEQVIFIPNDLILTLEDAKQTPLG